MRGIDQPDLDLRTATGPEINQAMTQGALDALREHKRAGDSVVVWDEGRVVIVPPEAIVIPDQADEELGSAGMGKGTQTNLDQPASPASGRSQQSDKS